MGYFRAYRQKQITHYAFVSLHYSLYIVRKMGMISETDFHAQWAAHLAWYLRGLTLQQGEEVWNWVVENFLIHHWRDDVRQILDQHRQAGNLVVLVSSGPTPLVKRIASELGVSHAIGTQFEVRAGRYTGRHLNPICIGKYKAQEARAYLQKKGESVMGRKHFNQKQKLEILKSAKKVGILSNTVRYFVIENIEKCGMGGIPFGLRPLSIPPIRKAPSIKTNK